MKENKVPFTDMQLKVTETTINQGSNCNSHHTVHFYIIYITAHSL